MQMRTSLRTASLLVSGAIKDLLNTFPNILSKVGTFGLGVWGVLMKDDAAWDIGERGVVRCSLVREDSPDRTLVLFLGG